MIGGPRTIVVGGACRVNEALGRVVSVVISSVTIGNCDLMSYWLAPETAS